MTGDDRDDERALKLLAWVQRELQAAQCRIEIGGAPIDDPRWVSVPVGEHRRLVALFDATPADTAAVRERLDAIVAAFEDTATAAPSVASLPVAAMHDAIFAALHAEVAAFAEAAGGVVAAVVDAASPVVWGRSHPVVGDEVAALMDLVDSPEAAARRAERERATSAEDWPVLLRAAHAVAQARAAAEDEPQTVATLHRVDGLGTDRPYGVFAFAGGYLLAVAFPPAFSQPRAERAWRSYRARLERLVERLPPVDPPPRKAKVLTLRRD